MTQLLRRPFICSLARIGRRYCSVLSASRETEPESWKSMEGLVRCSANYAPLSPIGFLERSSKAYRDSTSLIYGSLRYTWALTHQRCLKLASSLVHHLGLSRGDVVATFSYNLPEMYELHFAVPMAGAVLCPLNARLDAPMLSLLLGHSDAKVLCVDPDLLETAHEAISLLIDKPPVLVLLDSGSDPDLDSDSGLGESYERLVESGDEGFEARRPRSEWDPISVSYTSGTTSKPKAVVYSHRGAYLNSLATVLLHNVGPRGVQLLTAPMFHCNGWCLVWGGAAQGAASVCVRKPTAKAVFEGIADHGATHMGGVPTLLSTIANAPPEDRRPLPHAVHVLTGGSPPLPNVVTKMEEMGFRVNHIYGMTETYGPATNCVWNPAWDDLPTEEQCMMRCRQGVRHLGLEDVDVRDPVTMQSVPADGRTLGEVMFRGNTVMIGYLKDEGATREAFKGGWLRSGDLAVKHPDHYIQIKDRAKDVVISGGENVSTVEVETAIYGHEAVLEAAVVGRPDKHWGETPCAFVALKDGFRVGTDEIIEFCRARLPRYMVPRTVVFGELPKTSTGKIQKFLLREKAKAMGSL